jgi:hypothetical protein
VAGVWFDPQEVLAQLRAAGYEPTVLIPVRAQPAAEASQAFHGHASSDLHARARVQAAIERILRSVGGSACHLISYGDLGRQRYREWLAEVLGLPRVPTFPHVDADAKWFAEQAIGS